jgi:hypothetical protein
VPAEGDRKSQKKKKKKALPAVGQQTKKKEFHTLCLIHSFLHPSIHSPSLMSTRSTADTLLHLSTTPDSSRNKDLEDIAKRLQVEADFRYVASILTTRFKKGVFFSLGRLHQLKQSNCIFHGVTTYVCC